MGPARVKAHDAGPLVRAVCSAGGRATLGDVADADHPIPNLTALREHLPEGLARQLIDDVATADSMAEVTERLAETLRKRVAEIEEGPRATPEVG